jgi:N,N-dimethylformamidase beta subunit-like protein
MRANVGRFIRGSGNVAFFSGNTCWWRIHLEDNNTAFSREDNWPDDNRETKLTGVSYRHAGGWWAGQRDLVGYTVQHADHWVFEGTGLHDGAIFGAEEALVGYECDDSDIGTVRILPIARKRDTPGAGIPATVY